MTVETTKINITSLKKHKEKVLEIIQDKEIVDIVENEGVKAADQEELDHLEYKAAEVKTAIKFLESKQNKEGGILASLIPEKIAVKKNDFKNIGDVFEGENVTSEVLGLEEKLNETKSNLKQAECELEEIEKWKKLTLTSDQQESLQRTKIILGKLPKIELEKLLVKIKKTSEKIAILKGGEDERMIYLAFIFSMAIEEKLRGVLKSGGFEQESPDLTESPYEQNRKQKEKIQNLKEEKRAIKTRIEELIEEVEKLKIYHDWLVSKLKKKKTEKHLVQSERVFTITGWVREDQKGDLERALLSCTDKVAVTEAEKRKGEAAPVVLKNKGSFKYYEMITRLYGMPRDSEPDPTAYLAPFFTAFFAVAITDAGYGIIMMILSVVLLRFTDLPGKGLFKIFFWAGIFTLVIGSVFGGWFGISAPDLPASLGPIKVALVRIMWMDPVQNPVKMLVFTFVLGIFQIIAGIGVAAYWDISRGRVKEGLMDHASWILFLAAIFGWMAVKFGYVDVSPQVAKYGLGVVTLAFLYCQGRGQKNPIKRMLVGAGSLYDLLGYVSDVLSYSRLLALGLATAIIAMVVNLIAGIFMGMIPIPGLNWVFVGLILIVGHSFNLAVNSLSGFIHSARLQFVEFFPKFMKGGGQRFDPFKNEGDYVQLTDK